jgi:hypothetical protein
VTVGWTAPEVVVAALVVILELEMPVLDRITEAMLVALPEAGTGKTVAVERRIDGVELSVEGDALVEDDGLVECVLVELMLVESMCAEYVLIEYVLVAASSLLWRGSPSNSQNSHHSQHSGCLPSFLSCSEQGGLLWSCLREMSAGERSAATMTVNKAHSSVCIRMVVGDLVGEG